MVTGTQSVALEPTREIGVTMLSLIFTMISLIWKYKVYLVGAFITWAFYAKLCDIHDAIQRLR